MTSPQPHVESARDLLLEQLGKLLTVEETLAKRVLPQLVQQIQDEQLSAAVSEHLEQTRSHVGNVQRAFVALGEIPEGRPAQGLDGLVLEREAKVAELVPALRGGFDCAAAMGTEHYEINAYESAIRLADALGAEEVSSLLRSVLDQEAAALEKLATHADRLAESAVEQRTPAI
jgi:ferritin-like metal-binding protein YciE